MTGTDQLEGRICQQLQAGPPVDYDGEVADAWMAARLVVLLTEEVPALVLTAIRASAGEGEAPADHEARVAVVATKLKEKAAIRADLIRRDSNQPWDFDLEARGILQALSLGEAPAEPWGEGPLGVTGDIPEDRPSGGEAPAGLTPEDIAIVLYWGQWQSDPASTAVRNKLRALAAFSERTG